MPRRIDLIIRESAPGMTEGAGTSYLIQTPAGVLYSVSINGDTDLAFRKSTDQGLSWTQNTDLFAGTVTALSVWYDRWSNIAAGLIHIAWQESGTDDTLYRTIDTESSDALSTQTTIFAGVSTAAGGHLSIARAVGGNVYCKTVIDAGAEGGFFRLLNADVPNGVWASRTVDEVIATQDQMILLPDYDAADNQDMLAIFWDASANEISRKLYDNSANTWSETSIATGMVDDIALNGFPHFAVAMDITNTQHILIAWSGVDTLNADLRCWTVDATTITAKTDVITNSTDDQGLAGLTLDIDGKWWAYYVGATDGSETWPTDVHLYCKCSTDSGTTWGPETKLSPMTRRRTAIFAIPRLLSRQTAPPIVMWHNDFVTSVDETTWVNLDIVQPHANLQVGI